MSECRETMKSNDCVRLTIKPGKPKKQPGDRFKRQRITGLAASLSFIAIAANTLSPANAASIKTKTGADLDKATGVASLKSTGKYNAKALHRFDFRIVGKSCPVCLLGIQKRMSLVPGAVTVAVMTKKPYAAVAIYDSTKTNTEKLLEKAREGLTGIRFEDQADKPIAKVPTIVIPRLTPGASS